LLQAAARLGRARVKDAVNGAQRRAREGDIAPEAVVDEAIAALAVASIGPREVINATGVLLHTNLGRAPLSPSARRALAAAAGFTDVELDLATGRRGRRGRGVLAALAAAVPDAQAVHVVNNGAAALVLAATALAAGREIVVSKGELIEIGDGFRLPDLLRSTGADLNEVGTTNRTRLADYRAALSPRTGFILKVHPSNYWVEGFTGSVPVAELSTLGVPVVVDIGSGLLAPEPALPDEPDATSMLRAGATLVIGSADKLLGGPQGGLLLGDAEVIERLRRHPLARALRVDKLTLAALEATVLDRNTPTLTALRMPIAVARERASRLVETLRRQGVEVVAVDTVAAVGAGGAPAMKLPSAAISLPPEYAETLRGGDPAVLGRVERGRCLLDLRAVPEADDARLARAVLDVAAAGPSAVADPASAG
jgi:L-seryl-tRNA(Ser) seleniumtransferase